MNGEQLVMLLMEHGIGVHRSTPDLFEIDEEFALVGKREMKATKGSKIRSQLEMRKNKNQRVRA